MSVKHFTQSETYKNSLPKDEAVAINSGAVTAYGYIKRLPLGIKILYIPHSPIITLDNQTDFSTWLLVAKNVGQKLGCAFVRFDPQLPFEADYQKHKLITTPKSAYRSFFIQPRFEWQSQTKPLIQLLSEFNQSTRRDYTLAERADAKINFYTDFEQTAFDQFYALMEQTAKVQNFKPQTKAYTEKMVREALLTNAGFLSIVTQNNQPIAGTFTITVPHQAFYVFGGLNYQAKLPGATIFLHSQIINYLYNLGFDTYNFGAINHEGQNPAYQGVTTFKKRFPGEVVDYGPLYDLLIKPVWYYIYTLIRWQRDLLKQLKKSS